MLAATAGIVRWVTMSQSTELIALAVVQPLHGFTFALLHLACMRMIAVIVPPQLAATAQALYAFGAGLATALLTLVSGRLYGQWGGEAFLLMAFLCAAALPAALNSPDRVPGGVAPCLSPFAPCAVRDSPVASASTSVIGFAPSRVIQRWDSGPLGGK